MVEAPAVGMLIEGLAACQPNPLDETRIHQKLEISVDRGSRNCVPFLSQVAEQRFRIDVPVGPKDLPQQNRALHSGAQTPGSEKTPQTLFFG